MNYIVSAFKREFGAHWLPMLIGFGAWCCLGGIGFVLVVLALCMGDAP